MTSSDRKIETGDYVRLRPESPYARQEPELLGLVGEVIAAELIEGFGYGIKVQCPDREAPWAFKEAGHFELVACGWRPR